jgi:hypothetical protein
MLVVALARPARAGAADPRALLAALETDDPGKLAVAVGNVEHAPTTPELADALYAAARACDERLADPGRALALYQRIERELPDARVAAAADRRAATLVALVGPHGEHAAEGAELAHLVAEVDRTPPAEVIRRADALAARAWPGAAQTALWLADWLRRAGRAGEAEARYTAVAARWPDAPQAALARVGAAGAALDAHAWARGRRLALALPHASPADQHVRDDLLAAAARGARLDRIHTAAWLLLVLSLVVLVGSLAEALRGRRVLRGLRPPVEVVFLAPVAGVLVAVALTAHEAIAPAVARISAVGVVVAWLSGAALERLRADRRPLRARAALHVGACFVAVVTSGYLALAHDGLLDLLVQTVRFGPGN